MRQGSPIATKLNATQLKTITIGIVNSPIYSANERIFLDNHIQTLQPLSGRIFVMTGNFPFRYNGNVHVIEIEKNGTRPENPPVVLRILAQIVAQTKLTLCLNEIAASLNLVLFDIGEYRNIMPLLFAKILRKKTLVIHLGGNKSLESRFEYQSGLGKIIPPIQDILMRLFYTLVDNILCISPSIVEFGQLQRYKHKIMMYGGESVDSTRFTIGVKPTKRDPIVGYAGRHVAKKGLLNLIRAIPLVHHERPDVGFLIAGSGEQHDALIKEVEAQDAEEAVTFVPWIPSAEYPKLLNSMKLFVQPSYEEGVPVTLKEAMASGAIVLATPVGGIPDLIENEKTGFIMKDNSPATIAQTILVALGSSRLDEIAEQARSTVEAQASHSAIVRKWQQILELTMTNQRK